MKKTATFIFTAIMLVAVSFMAHAQNEEVTLITNVNIFDGENEKLLEGYDILVVKNLIKKIDKDIKIADSYEIDVKTGGLKEMPGAHAHDLQGSGDKVVVVYEPEKEIKKEVKVKVIDGQGRTLIPGLIDNHWHTMMNFWPVSKVLNADIGYLSLAAAVYSKETLLRGYTTVRDVGGPSFGVHKAIETGFIVGPRMFVSGPYISQSSGHGDFRGPLDVPTNPGEPLSYNARTGFTLIADGVPAVMMRTREALRLGATQVKAMAGGGVSSLYDPLDVTEYTFEEAKAICDVAATWNTYVAIHANTDEAIHMWVEAGAKSVEHGFFISDETAKLMAEKGVWWSMQAMDAYGEDAFEFENPISSAKYIECVSGLESAMAACKKYNVKIAWGTDMLFDPVLAAKQGKFLAKMQKWFTPYEVLKMATHDNAELVEMCGPRNPYQEGELGVIKEGAYADLIVVEGNPLEDIDLVADPENNFKVIMKDGKVYKNTLK
ncbi:metal-dependent hydrolase family protein [Maribellus mangrovi]|uniref:metal-dependent hydrolase family protein n=1 Tax=Maribellus mangrovi TaxID=3133146 RepID=UPI0030EDE9C6